MTTQERINQLATKALRAAPPTAAAPQPVTFMPSFDKLKAAEFVTTPVVAPAPVAAPAPAPPNVVAFTPSLEVVSPANESDPELKEMLDSRDGQRSKREKRNNRLATAALFLLFATGGTWLTVSPTARGKVGTLVTAVQQSGKDVKSLTGIMGTYEKQLDKVAVQGARIDAASLALGADPNSNASAQDASISNGMNELTGEGGGPTVMERDANLQKKFGIVGKLGKDMAPKTGKAGSDVTF
ncbi:hypothetical protein [Luteolibacter sp. Populi]|uniref:hypothetical protein n=1 Tax=Luteolibacter sp. Populi TaxID=3230487 RepID=UPI003465DD61